MRVIKFKALTTKGDGWATGLPTIDEDGNSIIIPSRWLSKLGQNYVYPGYRVSRVDASTVCQYIGLKDINGKDVYEGDIVHLHRNGKYTYIVEWKDRCATFVARCRETGIGLANLNENSEIEVIGNIYANDE